MRNLQVRRAIFYGFITVFLISAPATVLFTAGIRWSFEQGITKTGTIFVASIPKNASIYLNDKLQEDTTPTVIKRQQPGLWDVRLELEDHLPWQKNLLVLESSTTFIDNVILFLDISPELLIADKMSSSSWSPDRESIAWANHQEGWTEIWISRIDRPASSLVSRFTLNDKVGLDWIDNNLLSITNGRRVTLVDKTGEIFEDIPVSTPRTILKIADNATQVIDSQSRNVLARIPVGEYEIIDERGGYITLHDIESGSLALINRDDNTEPLLLLEDATSAEWIREDVLLFGSRFAISIYEPSKHETTLITRISDEIKEPQWHPAGGYIFYTTGNQIKVVELDDRDGRRSTVLADLDSIVSFTVGDNGKSLYILGGDGIDVGLFKRELYNK